MAIGLIIILVIVAIGLASLLLASEWIVFKKAGKPGWASIVPLYNGWTLAEIGGKPGWLGLIASFSLSIRSTGQLTSSFLVVFGILVLASFIIYVYICLGVAQNFNKSTGFGFLLGFLPFIGFPMLAFGNAQYKGKALGSQHLQSRQFNSPTNPSPKATASNTQPYKMSEDESLKWVLPINRSAWAIAAGYLAFFGFLIFPAPIVLIVGLIALRDIKKHKGKLGKGRAWFAISVGILGTGVLAIAFIASLLHG